MIRSYDRKRLLNLANSFPTLRGVLDTWEPDDVEWRCGRFSMRDICGWDEPHLAAFADWAQDPFWP